MISGVDEFGFLNRSMIQPQHNVAVIPIGVVVLWACDADRLVCIVTEDGERACCIESYAFDRFRIYILLANGIADG